MCIIPVRDSVISPVLPEAAMLLKVTDADPSSDGAVRLHCAWLPGLDGHACRLLG